ncbi:hypothetical protein KR222_010492 [Zaprionus bogoriensis]|nr:hypothetical protein KR222_010492 [Zaprionus bogoriensis]
MAPREPPPQAAKTPLARKTRSSRILKQIEDNENEDLPSTQLLTDTPRRSARKSVRPPKDYFDIVENSSMRSASKSKRDNELAKGEEEEEEAVVQQKTAAEAGKKARKPKRKAKKSKSRKENCTVEAMELEQEDGQKAAKEECASPVLSSAACAEAVIPSEQPAEEAQVEQASSPPSIDSEMKSSSLEDDKEMDSNQVEIIDLNLTSSDADFDDLGLRPLDSVEDVEVEVEEMASLIVVDDDMEGALNRTFDAGGGSRESSPPAQAVEQQEQPQSQCVDRPNRREVPVKIVLTDDQDRNTTLNTTDCLATDKPKAEAYRFPTPFKAKSKPQFKFGKADESARKSQLAYLNKELEPSCSLRRRSKSFSELNRTKNKTVSFFSPIEVAAVNEIDQRWESLNVSKVQLLNKCNTPGKLKPRTKLPNFAAIHQKQFNNMENIMEHMERKAARAKNLISSAVKQQQQPALASAQKSAAKKAPGSNALAAAHHTLSKAAKKIELSSGTPLKRVQPLAPIKPAEAQRQQQLSSSRILVQPQLKSRLPLPLPATTAAKVFTATAASRDAADETCRSKVEARRQRHMEMFKSRNRKENKFDFIRGVRTNRRFQLQMEHRQQLEENKK